MDRNVRTVLEVLYPLGVGMENDIANPLRQLFPIASRTDLDLPHQISLLKRFLNYLVEDGILHIEDKSSYLNLGQDHPGGGKRYLDGENPISAAMTLKAYEQYEKMLEKERGEDLDSSIKKTNKSVKDTNYWVKRSSIASAFIAFVTLLYIALDYYKSTPKTDKIDISPQTNQLKESQRLIDSIRIHQRGIEESLRTLASDSTKNVLIEKR